jgi:hypothetical protein
VNATVIPLGSALVRAIADYCASWRWWRGPPDMLMTKIGMVVEDKAVMFSRLTAIGDALAKHGIAMEINAGYVTLERVPTQAKVTPDLCDTIAAYMRDRVIVSALPDRMLVVMRQPPAADATTVFTAITDALAERGVRLFLDCGHVVLEHRFPPSAPGVDGVHTPRSKDDDND